MMELLCGQYSGVCINNGVSSTCGLKSKFRNDIGPSGMRSLVFTNTVVESYQSKNADISLHLSFDHLRYGSHTKCASLCSRLPDNNNGKLAHDNEKPVHNKGKPILKNGKAVYDGANLSQICISDSYEDLCDARIKILFAAGGTGGHVYPAIAIANEVRRLEPTSHIQFVGSKDRMEWSAVPKAGYPIKPLTAAGLQRPYMSFQNLLLPFKLLFSMWLSWKIIKDFRPDVVVGTGGYVAAPVCLVAALTGHPLVIQEQNACPGITNRILSQFAIKIFVAFSSAASFFPKEKCALRGNPTRLAFNRYISSAVSRRLFFPNGLPISLQAVRRRKHSEQAVLQANSDSVEVLLILGGSLGARSINLAVAGMVSEMLEKYPGRHVIWQTGVKYFDQMVSLVKGHPRLVILGFIDKMEMAFAAADLVVARAGAITCSEILVAGKPSILVPSSNVAEDHQMKNASFMVQTGASKLLLDKGLNSETLATVINDTLGSKGLVQGMSANASKAAAPYAARQIAEELLLIARKKAADTLCKSSAKICFT